jgi:hypothetical protein
MIGRTHTLTLLLRAEGRHFEHLLPGVVNIIAQVFNEYIEKQMLQDRSLWHTTEHKKRQ